MKNFAKIWVFPIAFLLFLSGCSKKVPSAYRAVTAVDISFRYEDTHLQRHYTQNDKIESVLLYMRLLKPLGKPASQPPADDRDVYDITVRFSDGSTKLYHQKAHRFFSRREQVWERIDPGQASELYHLMRHYPSDI